ncbi:MAG TPA: hypothetical protein VFO65_10905, partial [Acidimicrobiales bacterium]|nr:hypothetical protein [Acidimicrobiales bacterium]
ARLAFRLAEDCEGEGRRLAAGLWPRLARLEGQGAALFYDLEGRRLSDVDHPVGLVGAAAAARAAGEAGPADRLLRRAAALSRRSPTYYGTAWVALGEALMAPGGRG